MSANKSGNAEAQRRFVVAPRESLVAGYVRRFASLTATAQKRAARHLQR